MLNQNMRIISQSDRLNLPYNLISIFIYQNKIYARTITDREYIIGKYSTEEKTRYIFGQILSWSNNTHCNYYHLPEDEKVNLDDLN